MTDKVELTRTQEVIFYHLMQRPLGTGELLQILREKANVNDDETILINCKQLVEKGLIYDKETKKGKYRIVENPKIPAFLMFRARNRSLKSKILNDIFPSTTNNESIKSLEDFSKNIGIYILYILLEATRPGGPWTSKGFKTNDSRMSNIDLLRETWLEDTIDQDSFFKQFLLFKKYNDNGNYQEFVKRFESSFPDIYNRIKFHERIAEVRRLKKKQNKKPLSTTSSKELEDYDPVGLQDYWDRRNKNKIRSD